MKRPVAWLRAQLVRWLMPEIDLVIAKQIWRREGLIAKELSIRARSEAMSNRCRCR